MKVIYTLFLLVFAAAVGLFVYFNHETIPVKYLDQSLATHTWELPFPAVVGGTYLLGMLSGWTVLGLLRRSVRTVADDVNRRI